MRRFLPVLLLLLALCLSPSRAMALPIQEIETKRGIKAWLLRDESLPLVTLNFTFDGGSEFDPPDKQGLANLSLAMLTEGAGPLKGDAFLRALNDNNVRLSFLAGRDALSGSLKTTTETRGAAFRLLRLALTAPEMSQDAFARLKAETIARIRDDQQDPEWQAFRTLFATYFAGHPYAQRPLGSEKTLATITRDDAVNFVRTRLYRDGLRVVAVGDITPQKLAALLDGAFGDLPKTAARPLAPVAFEPGKTLAGQILSIPREGAQATYIAAAPGLTLADPDWLAAQLVNYSFGGGGFQSRLMTELRDKRGWVYGASSSFLPFDAAPLFTAATSLKSERAGEVTAVINDLWKEMAKGPTAAELTAAKAYFTGAFVSEFQSTDKIAALLMPVLRAGLSPQWLSERAPRLAAVTEEDARRVAERLFTPGPLLAVMVGGEKTLTHAQRLSAVP